MMSINAWVLICLMIGQIAYGQLYLMTGTPTPKDDRRFASALFQVGEDGSLRLVSEVMPQNVGTEWIAVSYEFRKAVLVAQAPRDPIVVVDFDKAAVVKKCNVPPIPGKPSQLAQWLADPPGIGPAFERNVTGDNLEEAVVQAMTLDPSVACAESFKVAPASDLQYAAAHGTAGVAGTVPADGFHVAIDRDGKVLTWLAGTTIHLSAADFPEEMRKEAEFSDVLVNNSRILVLQTVSSMRENPRSIVFRKSDQTWHVIPLRTFQYPPLRGFGKFVAIAEHQAKKATLAQAGQRNLVITQSMRIAEHSAGRNEWRKEDGFLGPGLEEFFAEFPAVYPGRLHLYDADTERIYTIETKQGDSEIVLVENDTVYYRISNRLYAAAITEKGIGPARLLATAEEIRDAHWAFIKH